MRIFIGCTEIAGLINVYADELRRRGHSVTTYTVAKNKYYPNEQYDITGRYWADYLLGRPTDHPFDKPQGLLNRVAFSTKVRLPIFNTIISKKIFDQHDVFIFLWAGVYLTNHANDLQILKQKGKKIISILVGSDVRYHAAFDQEFGTRLQWPSMYLKSFSHFNRVLRKVEKYSDAVFSVPDQMGLAFRPYHHFQIPLNLEKYKYNLTGRDIPVVVHAPSNSALKGTSIILETFERLKKEGVLFEVRFIQNMSNPELLQLLSDSDILVDELIFHGPGVLSFEAMASGCAVATCYYKDSPKIFRPPVCAVDNKNVYSTLKKLILDKSFREETIQAGRQYVEQNNSVGKVVNDILKKAEAGEGGPFDYTPAFFRDKFKLPGSEKIRPLDKKLNQESAKRWIADFDLHKDSLQKRNLV